MNIRSIALVVIAATATSVALAEAPAHKAPVGSASQGQTVLQDLTVAMREILRVVTPEIALPAIEIKLPRLPRG